MPVIFLQDRVWVFILLSEQSCLLKCMTHFITFFEYLFPHNVLEEHNLLLSVCHLEEYKCSFNKVKIVGSTAVLWGRLMNSLLSICQTRNANKCGNSLFHLDALLTYERVGKV